jgi:hypothetical protein fuD12_02509
MNREIKFRIWDKKSKRWVKNFNLNLLNVNDFNVVSINQFTGLKDKKQKEIYEGDIIKLIYFRDGRKRETGKVVFLNHQASFGIIDRDGNEYPLYRNTAKQIEVIGNIYENFELTEKGNNYGKQNREND